LEWTDSELILPKSIADTSVLLSADVEYIGSKIMPLNEVIDKIANLIVQWNTEKTYCLYRLTGKQANEGNCQDFVEAVLDTLKYVNNQLLVLFMN